MPRRDIYHESVRLALENEKWAVTDDPLTVPTSGLDFHIDLGATRDWIGAQKENEQIAVEIKSLRGNSVFYDYHQALGQFLMYRLALQMIGSRRRMFLAIPENEYQRLSRVEIYPVSWREFSVNLLVFNENTKQVTQWVNN